MKRSLRSERSREAMVKRAKEQNPIEDCKHPNTIKGIKYSVENIEWKGFFWWTKPPIVSYKETVQIVCTDCGVITKEVEVRAGDN